MAQMRRIERWI